jgi:hypothetical protein
MTEPMTQTASDPPKPEAHFTYEGRKPQKPSNLLLILMILVIVGLVGYGGYYLGIQTNKPVSQYVAPSPLTITTNPTPTASVDPTAGWKTYSNSTYGYQVKYPPNLSVKENTIVQSVQFTSQDTVYIEIIKEPQTKNFNSVSEYLGEGNGLMLKSRIIGDIQWWYDSNSANPLHYSLKQGKIYGISIKNVQSVDQILSTFKFTN